MRQAAIFDKQGEARDLPFHRVPEDYWHEVENVHFRGGCAVPARGDKAIWTSITTYSPRTLQWAPRVNSLDQNSWFIMGGDDGSGVPHLRYFDPTGTGSGGTDITPAIWTTGGTYVRRGDYSGGVFNTINVFNVYGDINSGGTNGLFPVYSPVSGTIPATAVILPGWNVTDNTQWRCRSLRPFKYHLVAMYKIVGDTAPTDYPNTVFWSDAATSGAPATWTASATNQAGETELADTKGVLVDGGLLGEDFIIYKQYSCYRMTYVGGTEVFQFKRVSAAAGAAGVGSIASYRGVHFVFGKDDLYMMTPDGEIKSIVEPWNRRSIFAAIQSGSTSKLNPDHCFVVANPIGNEVLFCYADGSNGTPNKAIVYDCATGRTGRRDLDAVGGGRYGAVTLPAQSWNTSRTVAPGSERAILLGGTDNSRYYLALDDPGAAATYPTSGTSSLTSRAIDLGQPQKNKLVTAIRLRADATATETFNITITGRQILDDSYDETSGSLSYVTGSDQKADCLVSGKYFDVTISCSGDTNPPWKLYGFELEYEMGGDW